ncbi:hypothetical protein AwPolaro_06360 [Polaromonas sp.]|nr:hypothetical protein AwPolaro_06360 [Polaromonas sp.]
MRAFFFPLLLVLSAGLAHADAYTDVNHLIGTKQFPEALASVEKHLAAKPRDPQMRFLKGVIQGETDHTAEALETFSKITEDYPELPEPYNNIAVLHARQNQLVPALAALEMAVRINPAYAAAQENLGDIYARLAEQAYAKSLQLNPGNAGLAPKLALVQQLQAATP